MASDDTNSGRGREERLAEKLRENLRRRKAQARAKGGAGTSADRDLSNPARGG
ncbi:hypothetical protein [Aurantiacibacter spongiae]|uniref:hypothetical protein n=1 Tax=Aurantiacibacter spongiae TaxID=2488860 RepID=UPI0013152BBC|nr:hypothetical protein [Aurantiacibacter spongiae]